MRAQGWYRSLFRTQDDRLFPDGRPDQVRAPSRVRPYRTVVVPCLAAFVVSGLTLTWGLTYPVITGFDSAEPSWVVHAGLGGELWGCLAIAALLIAGAHWPGWRRAIALTVWGIVPLQLGWSLLMVTASVHPSDWCTARPGWAAITLTNTESEPVVTAPPGAHIVVTVPGWNWGTATDVNVISGGILREDCTQVLPGGGRRTIFLAARPGSTVLTATVQPPSNLLMPLWGGNVIVRRARA